MAVRMRILKLVLKTASSIFKNCALYVFCGVRKYWGSDTHFSLPQDPAAPFTVKITNIFKFGIFAVFLMFHRKGECENCHFR